MGIQTVIGVGFDSVPLLRGAWRWLLERGLEVRITVEEGNYVPHGQGALIFVRLRLRLLNHRVDRAERIIGWHVELKRRRFALWHETVLTMPATLRDLAPMGHPTVMATGEVLDNILLEPLSFPREFELETERDVSLDVARELPRNSELMLVMDMVGPMRRVTRPFQQIVRNPAWTTA